MKYLTDHGISTDRLRLTQDGALEPDTLYTGEKKPVPSARVEIFALDEYVDKDAQSHSAARGRQQRPDRYGRHSRTHSTRSQGAIGRPEAPARSKVHA